MHRDQVNNTSCMKTISTLSAGLITAAFLLASAGPASAVSDRRIEDARFACLAFMKSQQEGSRPKDVARAEVAKFWLMGFLTGAFQADQVLEFTEEIDAAESEIVAKVKEYCTGRDENSIHAAAVYAGESPQPLPRVTNLGLNPSVYSCAAYSEGLDSRGDEKSRAKAAEFWAFAFVQGNMTVRYHPRLVVSVSDKRKIVRALKQSCQRNPTRNLLDQTAEIASRVRPDWDAGEWD